MEALKAKKAAANREFVRKHEASKKEILERHGLTEKFNAWKNEKYRNELEIRMWFKENAGEAPTAGRRKRKTRKNNKRKYRNTRRR